jgi:hypothetical protein|tara:strand:- start:28720 stop:28989 length:270 start_codon:yes stop_codon:yes gene_type:complete
MDKRKLKKLIMDYLVDQEEYNTYTKAEKKYIADVFKTIMDSIYLAIKHQNVIPVILTRDVDTQLVVADALSRLVEFIPTVGKVRIALIN